MKTAIFWLAWAIGSTIVLRTFYFRYSENKLKRLRYSAASVEFLTLALFALPWTKNIGIATVAVLLGASFVCFLTSRDTLLKFGVVSHSAATILFFISMIILVPRTVTLTADMIAPIVAALLMLVNIVVGLSLWRQLQLKEQSIA